MMIKALRSFTPVYYSMITTVGGYALYLASREESISRFGRQQMRLLLQISPREYMIHQGNFQSMVFFRN